MFFQKVFYGVEIISANQCEGGWDEGGKSPNMTDYHTGGNVNEPRMATYIMPDGTYGKTPAMIETAIYQKGLN